jgi:hypothetical protein
VYPAGKHKKELAPVEHSAVEYSTFRKKFYVEAAADIKSLSAEEVEEMRKASAVVVNVSAAAQGSRACAGGFYRSPCADLDLRHCGLLFAAPAR